MASERTSRRALYRSRWPMRYCLLTPSTRMARSLMGCLDRSRSKEQPVTRSNGESGKRRPISFLSRSSGNNQPRARVVNHMHQFADDPAAVLVHLLECPLLPITTTECNLGPDLGFSRFRLRIAEPTDKCSFVSPFPPCLTDIRTHGARGASNLVYQREPFFGWKDLGQLETAYYSLHTHLVHNQVTIGSNCFFLHRPITDPRFPVSPLFRFPDFRPLDRGKRSTLIILIDDAECISPKR